jgi:Protein of unknown function (DUF2512)
MVRAQYKYTDRNGSDVNMAVKPSRPILVMTATNGMYKFAGYGSVLIAADYLMPGLYPSLWPMFYTVAFLTLVGLMADLAILPRLGNVASLSIGFFGVLFIVWMTPQFWPDSHVTLLRAIGMTLCIAPLEYALHIYVLRSIQSE